MTKINPPGDDCRETVGVRRGGVGAGVGLKYAGRIPRAAVFERQKSDAPTALRPVVTAACEIVLRIRGSMLGTPAAGDSSANGKFRRACVDTSFPLAALHADRRHRLPAPGGSPLRDSVAPH